MSLKQSFAFFDFDYTLAKTTEAIRVFSPRGTRKDSDKNLYRTIYAPEYNNLSLANDESITEASFVEFDDLNIKKTQPIREVLFLYQVLHQKCDNVYIVSARPQKPENKICQFLENKTGIPKKFHTYHGCESSDPMKKSDFINKTLEGKMYDQIWLFDDSDKVIKHYVDLYSLDNRYNIIKICHRNGLQLHFEAGCYNF